MAKGFATESRSSASGLCYLGLDGGGSKTLAVLVDSLGREMGRGTAGPCNYQTVGVETAWQAILQAVRGAYQQAGQENKPADGLCLGLAGVGRAEDRQWVDERVRAENLAAHWLVVNDGQLLLAAGTPDGWGVGVISGTGSIAIGRAPDGREGRAGGWGTVLGDEGSGYAIGQAALQAVTRAADGRAPATALTANILSYWNLTQPAELVGKVYRSGIGRVEIAELAQLVLATAESGDGTARKIENGAATELAAQAVAVAAALRFQGDVPCALGGGVLAHSRRLVKGLLRQALRAGVRLAPVECVREPVKGAVRLALNLAQHGQ